MKNVSYEECRKIPTVFFFIWLLFELCKLKLRRNIFYKTQRCLNKKKTNFEVKKQISFVSYSL